MKYLVRYTITYLVECDKITDHLKKGELIAPISEAIEKYAEYRPATASEEENKEKIILIKK